MALPKEPRQKMINLMYLVLTALLALNVSAEILNAFKTVNGTLEASTIITESKISQIFRSFQEKLGDPNVATQAKAKIWNEKATIAKTEAESVYNYIQTLKAELLKQADFNPKDSSYKLDNLEVATRMFVEEKKGVTLQTKLTDLRNKLLSIDPEIKAQFERTLPIDVSIPKTENIANRNFSSGYFHMVPTVAALTILSKFQNDVKNAESQIVEYCHKKVGEVELVYDKFQVIANSSSTYMMPGEEFTINAGIGAYSSKAVPTITVGGASATRTPEGDYELKTKAESTPGSYSKLVQVSYIDPNTGQPSTVKKEIKYTVGAPSGLTVSTDKTRVFYQGLENLVSVTGSGGAEQIDFTVSGAGANPPAKLGKGQYNVTFTQTGYADVTAVDNKSKTKAEFRIPVKRVPDPLAVIGGIASGSMPVSRLRAQQGVIADLKDFIFEGVKYDVVGYFIMFTGPGFTEPETAEVTGPAFTPQIRQWLNRCQEGTTIIVGNIKVRGPGGARTLQQGITIVCE